MKNNKSQPYTIGIIDLLVILFIGLKLANVIDWSWWIVLAGWWVQIALGAGYYGLVVLTLALQKSNRANRRAQQKNK
jgi:hypothetical protein